MKPCRKHNARILKVLVLMLVVLAPGFSQLTSAQQALTLEVRELNSLGIVGGSLVHLVDLAPSQLSGSKTVQNAVVRISWTSNGDNGKITVCADRPAPDMTLSATLESSKALGLFDAPTVTFSSTEPRDLLLGIGRSAGACTFIYFVADVPILEEDSFRVITFTITSG